MPILVFPSRNELVQLRNCLYCSLTDLNQIDSPALAFHLSDQVGKLILKSCVESEVKALVVQADTKDRNEPGEH